MTNDYIVRYSVVAIDILARRYSSSGAQTPILNGQLENTEFSVWKYLFSWQIHFSATTSSESRDSMATSVAHKSNQSYLYAYWLLV